MIVIYKNSKVAIFDLFSNKPLCSLEWIDLSIDNKISFKNKISGITILVTEEIWTIPLKTSVTKSLNKNICKNEEFSIRDSLVRSYSKLFSEFKLVWKEFKTTLWTIDVLLEKDWTYHVFEIKKAKARIDVFWQLMRYWEYFSSIWKDYELYAVAERFNKKDILLMRESDIKTVIYKNGTFSLA